MLVYHERQLARMCGVHCLNNLFQGKHFSAESLNAIAIKVDEKEAELLCIKRRKSYSDHFAIDGYFSIEVLQDALKSFGLELVPSTHPDVAEKMKNPDADAGLNGFIVQRRDHWFALRRIDEKWAILNSLKNPAWVDKVQDYVSPIQAAGDANIFLIVGTLPEPLVEVNERTAMVNWIHAEAWLGEDLAEQAGSINLEDFRAALAALGHTPLSIDVALLLCADHNGVLALLGNIEDAVPVVPSVKEVSASVDQIEKANSYDVCAQLLISLSRVRRFIDTSIEARLCEIIQTWQDDNCIKAGLQIRNAIVLQRDEDLKKFEKFGDMGYVQFEITAALELFQHDYELAAAALEQSEKSIEKGIDLLLQGGTTSAAKVGLICVLRSPLGDLDRETMDRFVDIARAKQHLFGEEGIVIANRCIELLSPCSPPVLVTDAPREKRSAWKEPHRAPIVSNTEFPTIQATRSVERRTFAKDLRCTAPHAKKPLIELGFEDNDTLMAVVAMTSSLEEAVELLANVPSPGNADDIALELATATDDAVWTRLLLHISCSTATEFAGRKLYDVSSNNEKFISCARLLSHKFLSRSEKGYRRLGAEWLHEFPQDAQGAQIALHRPCKSHRNHLEMIGFAPLVAEVALCIFSDLHEAGEVLGEYTGTPANKSEDDMMQLVSMLTATDEPTIMILQLSRVAGDGSWPDVRETHARVAKALLLTMQEKLISYREFHALLLVYRSLVDGQNEMLVIHRATGLNKDGESRSPPKLNEEPGSISPAPLSPHSGPSAKKAPLHTTRTPTSPSTDANITQHGRPILDPSPNPAPSRTPTGMSFPSIDDQWGCSSVAEAERSTPRHDMVEQDSPRSAKAAKSLDSQRESEGSATLLNPELDCSPMELSANPKLDGSPMELPANPELDGSPMELSANPKLDGSPMALPANPELDGSPMELPANPELVMSPRELPANPELDGSPMELSANPELYGSPRELPANPELDGSPRELAANSGAEGSTGLSSSPELMRPMAHSANTPTSHARTSTGAQPGLVEARPPAAATSQATPKSSPSERGLETAPVAQTAGSYGTPEAPDQISCKEAGSVGVRTPTSPAQLSSAPSVDEFQRGDPLQAARSSELQLELSTESQARFPLPPVDKSPRADARNDSPSHQTPRSPKAQAINSPTDAGVQPALSIPPPSVLSDGQETNEI